MSDTKNRSSISLNNFLFGELRPDHKVPAPTAPPPPLGPLSAFVGDFSGNGFNTIFRPDSAKTPTALPNPVPPPPPPRDNILELNLTSETLSFSKSLGSVPNRGTGAQPDEFLNGVPYLQTVNDITIRGESVGIHFEPGMWIHVPATTIPPLGETFARMASIPHGTTIDAQGLVQPAQPGKPKIDPVDTYSDRESNREEGPQVRQPDRWQPQHAGRSLHEGKQLLASNGCAKYADIGERNRYTRRDGVGSTIAASEVRSWITLKHYRSKPAS